MKTYELKNTVRCNHGYSYKVSLKLKAGDTDWVLSVDNSPGSWYLKTLLGLGHFSNGPTGDFIWLDWGQRWSVSGMAEVIKEAVDYLLDNENYNLNPPPPLPSLNL
jgi:hypothetical protein